MLLNEKDKYNSYCFSCISHVIYFICFSLVFIEMIFEFEFLVSDYI